MSRPTNADRAQDAAVSLHHRVAMVQQACRGALTTEDLLEIAVAQARAAIGAAAGVLFMLDSDHLYPAVSHGYPPPMVRKWARTPVDDSTPAGRAVRTREGVWLSDPAEKQRTFPAVAQPVTGFAALAALPVMSGGEVLGVLGVSFREPRELDAVEQLFLLVLADQVGEALARLEAIRTGHAYIDDSLVGDRTRRRLAEEVRAALAESGTGLDQLISLARHVCSAEKGQVSLIGSDQFVAAATGGAEPGTVGPASDSLCTVTMSQRAAVVVGDALSDERVNTLPPVLSGNLRAYLGVPLTVEGQLVGALCVYDQHPRPWTSYAVEGLQTLAVAVQNELQLRWEAARGDRRLRLSNDRAEILDSLAAAMSPQQVAETLLRVVPAGTVAVAVVLRDESGVVLARRGSGAGAAERVAIASLAGQVSDSDDSDPRDTDLRTASLSELAGRSAKATAHLARAGMRQALIVRLPGRTTVTVVMAVGSVTDVSAIRDRWTALASVVISAADRAVTHERLRLAMARSVFLSTASTQLEASLDLEETLQQMARVAVPALASGCLVHLRRNAAWHVVAVAHVDAVKERHWREEGVHDAVVARVLGSVTTGRTIGQGQLDSSSRDRLRSVALRARGRLIAAITLVESVVPDKPGIADESLLNDLASHAAIVIDNALLYAKRGADLAALQQRLLPPRLPDVAGWQLAAFYAPGDDALEVGGDFYEAIVPSPDRLLLLVGDVCGRGAHAAAVTGLARTVLRAAIKESPEPEHALLRLNAAMREAGDGGEFCTVAIVDVRREGDSTSAEAFVAGHPAPFLRRGASVSSLDCRGPMVGLVAAPVFRKSRLSLVTGDVLVLYTDGVTEARRNGDLFGTERLAAAIARADPSPHAIVAAAVQEARAFGERADDDVAMLALRLGVPE